jgi:GlcNAc-P-P-Und epimerase
MNKKWLITGASGFIGTNYIQYLLEKGYHDIINIDKAQPLCEGHNKYWIDCNILDKEKVIDIFLKNKPDYVLHLAARTDVDGSTLSDYVDNTIGTENIISAIQVTSSVRHVIFTSTQYVFQPGDVEPRNEEDYLPHTEYGQSKVLNELAVRNANLHCIRTIIRPTNIWGPWHLRYRDQFIRILYKGMYFHPKIIGTVKSYGYVGNVVDQIYKIFNTETQSIDNKVLYVGDLPIKLIDWVNCFSRQIHGKKVRLVPLYLLRALAIIGDIIEMSGMKFPLNSSRYANMISDYNTSMDETIDVLGIPPFNLEQGVSETIKWIKSSESNIDYRKSVKNNDYN